MPVASEPAWIRNLRCYWEVGASRRRMWRETVVASLVCFQRLLVHWPVLSKILADLRGITAMRYWIHRYGRALRRLFCVTESSVLELEAPLLECLKIQRVNHLCALQKRYRTGPVISLHLTDDPVP